MGQNQNNQKNSERREAIRVVVNFPLSYSRIPLEEFEAIKGSFCAHSTSDREGRPSPLYDVSGLNLMEREMEESLGKSFVQMWRMIDQKLNLIYSELAKDKSGAWEIQANCVELGANGLKIMEKSDLLKPGEILKLRISPLTFPPFSIVVLGRVQRVVEKEVENGAPMFEVAITYDAINKDDREGLFAYLFKRQREIIRSGNK